MNSLNNQRACYKKLFGNRFGVNRSKIDFCESDLKNKWPNSKPQMWHNFLKITPMNICSITN